MSSTSTFWSTRMLMRTRLSAAAFLLATLTGCGDDSGSGPPPYPAVEGTYQLNGTFTGTSNATFAGSVTLLQASRSAAPLTGSATINWNIGGSSGTVSGLSNASVTQNGQVSFQVGGASSSGGSWTFNGVLTNRTIAGQHTLAGGGNSYPGTFSAVRQ